MEDRVAFILSRIQWLIGISICSEITKHSAMLIAVMAMVKRAPGARVSAPDTLISFIITMPIGMCSRYSE